MTDRETTIRRIMQRVIDYCNGEISAEEFAMQEEPYAGTQLIDEPITPAEMDAVFSVFNPNKSKGVSGKTSDKLPPFTMSLDEFNALSLHDQNELYKRYPKEIEQLVSPERFKTTGQITKARFLRMPQEEQSLYYEKEPLLVQALLDGRITFMDSI